MTAWTYRMADERLRYWIGHNGRPVIWVTEAPDGLNGFRAVDDGRLTHEERDLHTTTWQQRPLPLEWWPPWLLALHEDAMDIGL